MKWFILPLVCAVAVVVGVYFSVTKDRPSPKGQGSIELPIQGEEPDGDKPKAAASAKAEAKPKPKPKPAGPPLPPPALGTTGQTLGGVTLRVTGARVAYHFGDYGLVYSSAVPMLRVEVAFAPVGLVKTESFLAFGEDTSLHSRVTDDQGRVRLGVRDKHKHTVQLKTPSLAHATLFFEEPKRDAQYFDLEYAAPYLPEGQKYRLRIPAGMVQWPAAKK